MNSRSSMVVAAPRPVDLHPVERYASPAAAGEIDQDGHDMLVCLGVTHAAGEVQRRALQRESELEGAMVEVEKRQEAVRRTKAVLEEAISAATDEAMKAVMRARDSLLAEASELSDGKLSSLKGQLEGLTKALEGVHAKRSSLREVVESGHGHQGHTHHTEATAKAISALQEVLEAEEGLGLEPVVEDDLEYRGPEESKRKDLLEKLSSGGKGGGLWGKVIKKAVKPPVVSPTSPSAMMAPKPQRVSALVTSRSPSVSPPRRSISSPNRAASPSTLPPPPPPVLQLVGSVGVDSAAVKKMAGTTPSPSVVRLNQPFSVAVDSGRIYVADCANDRVVVLDKATLGQVQVMDGHGSSGSGRLSRPMGVAVDEKRVYVVESGHQAVRAFEKSTGVELWVAGGGYGSHFASPHDVVVDEVEGGYVYVADGYDGRVVVLDKATGKHVRSFDATAGFKRILVHRYSTGLPHGLALDPEQPRHLFVSYANGRHILVVDKMTAAPIRTFSTTVHSNHGKAGGRVVGVPKPYGMAVLGRYLYVADYHNHRVQVLDKCTGVHVVTPGEEQEVEVEQGKEKEDRFAFPTSVAVEGDRLYVCEYGGHRLTVFGPPQA